MITTIIPTYIFFIVKTRVCRRTLTSVDVSVNISFHSISVPMVNWSALLWMRKRNITTIITEVKRMRSVWRMQMCKSWWDFLFSLNRISHQHLNHCRIQDSNQVLGKNIRKKCVLILTISLAQNQRLQFPLSLTGPFWPLFLVHRQPRPICASWGLEVSAIFMVWRRRSCHSGGYFY